MAGWIGEHLGDHLAIIWLISRKILTTRMYAKCLPNARQDAQQPDLLEFEIVRKSAIRPFLILPISRLEDSFSLASLPPTSFSPLLTQVRMISAADGSGEISALPKVVNLPFLVPFTAAEGNTGIG